MFRLSLVLGVVALLLSSGCQTRIKPVGHDTITLATDTEHADVPAKLLYEITLVLPPLQRPDHVWQIAFADARFLKQTTELTRTPAGTFTVKFIPIHTGRTLLKFLAVPAQRLAEAYPTRSYDVRLTIAVE